MLNVFMFTDGHDQCHYAAYRYAECRGSPESILKMQYWTAMFSVTRVSA